MVVSDSPNLGLGGSPSDSSPRCSRSSVRSHRFSSSSLSNTMQKQSSLVKSAMMCFLVSWRLLMLKQLRSTMLLLATGPSLPPLLPPSPPSSFANDCLNFFSLSKYSSRANLSGVSPYTTNTTFSTSGMGNDDRPGGPAGPAPPVAAPPVEEAAAVELEPDVEANVVPVAGRSGVALLKLSIGPIQPPAPLLKMVNVRQKEKMILTNQIWIANAKDLFGGSALGGALKQRKRWRSSLADLILASSPPPNTQPLAEPTWGGSLKVWMRFKHRKPDTYDAQHANNDELASSSFLSGQVGAQAAKRQAAEQGYLPQTTTPPTPLGNDHITLRDARRLASLADNTKTRENVGTETEKEATLEDANEKTEPLTNTVVLYSARRNSRQVYDENPGMQLLQCLQIGGEKSSYCLRT
uniref:Uncharacterized protein n=1 Tax=Anopheles atroparvus TaxID=41427 RepID=A0A182IZ21_ANOAO